MAFKLSKADLTKRSELAAELRKAAQDIAERAEVAHDAVEDLNEAISAYNATLADVQAFRDEHREAWQDEYDDKSEAWQEGEKGEAVSSLISDWEALDLEELKPIEVPSAAPEVSHADDLEGLPSEVEL